MPFMACLGMLIGLLLGLSRPALLRARLRAWFEPVALLVVIAQFALLIYDPRAVLPTSRDEQAGRDFLALIRQYPGDVWIPSHSYYTAQAGKRAFVHWATITDTSGLWDTNLDVQRGGQNDPRRQSILDDIQAAVAARRFDAIILDDMPRELNAYWNALLAPHYRLERKVFAEPDVFWTVSGAPGRPQLLYVRR
jgi:hypothetical protein